MPLKSIMKPFIRPSTEAPIAYSKVPQPSSEVSFDDSNEAFLPRAGQTRSRNSRSHCLVWVANLTLFLSSVALIVWAYTRPLTDAECVRQLYAYSPALEAVEYHEEDYAGVFHQPSPYRGPPTPERDALWQQLWDYGAFNVPLEKLYLLNRSTETDWQRTPKEWGGGAAAMLWGHHQLHCLDMVRMATWREYYRDELNMMPLAFDGPEYLVRMHIDHCLELLRLHMMCHVDVTPYFVFNDETAPTGLRAEFSSHHKCRNFEKVQKWVVDNTAVA